MSTATATMHEPITHESQDLWGGGDSPFKAPWGKVMMWYFLVSDALSFSGLLITYGALRFSFEVWPDPNEVFSAFPGFGHTHLPLLFVSLMTFILIMSSVTMVRAVQEGYHNNKKGVMFWLFLTILGGIGFLSCQAWEWTHMITSELPITIFQNPYGGPNGTLATAGSGAPAFGQLFFTITGFHGFHVFTGVCINIIVLILVMKNVFQKKGSYEIIEKIGLYWHFVDLVWVFVFMAFYLL